MSKNLPAAACARYDHNDRASRRATKAISDGRVGWILLPPGYIEQGQTDKNYDWVTQFEKETGCAVNVKTAATSDEMVSLMAKGAV